MHMQNKTALISVSDKTGLDQFVRDLMDFGYTTIIGSSGTARLLREKGIWVQSVEEMVAASQRKVFADALDAVGITLGEQRLDAIFRNVGAPILNHRVVTLQKEVHAAIAATFDDDGEKTLKRLGIPRINLLCVDFYPLEGKVQEKGLSRETLEEHTDVGGPTMVYEAAVKGRQLVVTSRADRAKVIEWYRAGCPNAEQFRSRLALKARATVVKYQMTGLLYHARLAEFPYDELAEALNPRDLAKNLFETIGDGLSAAGRTVADFTRIFEKK